MREHSDSTANDEQLAQLLVSLRVTATPEADFEERFLYDFHERIARETVCCPARYRLLEHLQQMLLNFGPRRLAYGASSLGLGVLAFGFMAIPGEESHPTVAGVALSRLDSGISMLTPGLARDYDSCTSIRVEKKAAPYDRERVLVARESSYPESSNAYTSSTVGEESLWESAMKASADSFGPASFSY